MDYEVVEYLEEVKKKCTGLTSCRNCKLINSVTGECLIKGYPHEWGLPDIPVEIRAKNTIKKHCASRSTCEGCTLYSPEKFRCSIKGDFNPDQW